MKRAIALAVLMILAANTAAFAASPEFSRTEEEWAKLRDNTLEYGEIDDLVREFNATVKKNDHDLVEFKRKYGTTNTEVRDAYTEMALEIRNNIVSADTSSPTYGMAAMQTVISDSSASSLESMADSSVEDYEIYRLSYEMARKNLALSGKNLMISYYDGLAAEEKAELNKEMLAKSLETAGTKASLGMSTRADVLSAESSLSSADRQLTNARTDTESRKKKLAVLCGWTYEGSPVLGSLPEPDMEKIAAIDLAADTAAALENNYTLRINRRKLENASSSSQKDSLNAAIEGNVQNIGISVNTAYQNLLSARSAYEYAVTSNELQQKYLERTGAQYKTGNASAVELRNQEITARNAELSLLQAKYALLGAIENYYCIIGGLASA